MKLEPCKTKFSKEFKGKIYGSAKRGFMLSFGWYGLKALESKRIKASQIEAARKAINKYLKRSGKLWIKAFPNTPVSKKPTEVRMGKGKGNIEYYANKVKKGKVLFELDYITEKQAKNAFNLASSKLPIKTRFIKHI